MTDVLTRQPNQYGALRRIWWDGPVWRLGVFWGRALRCSECDAAVPSVWETHGVIEALVPVIAVPCGEELGGPETLYRRVPTPPLSIDDHHVSLPDVDGSVLVFRPVCDSCRGKYPHAYYQ